MRRRARRGCGGSRSWRATTSAAATRESLLYASADARKVHEILTRLGGVRAEDATLLIGASASQLLSAIVAVEMQAAEAARRGERTALLFYYSGHAKDGALRLGETRIPIDGIKARIAVVADRRAHRDPRLVQVGRVHADARGRARRPRSRSSPRARATPRGSSS